MIGISINGIPETGALEGIGGLGGAHVGASKIEVGRLEQRRLSEHFDRHIVRGSHTSIVRRRRIKGGLVCPRTCCHGDDSSSQINGGAKRDRLHDNWNDLNRNI